MPLVSVCHRANFGIRPGMVRGLEGYYKEQVECRAKLL
jgi:hypothetical protein